MPSLIGTGGNDTFIFSGVVTNVSLTITNPYSGKTLTIDDEYNVNDTSYEGLAGIDTLNMTNIGDALFLTDNIGNIMLANVERIFAGDGGDLIVVSHETLTYGNLSVDGGASDDILWTNTGNDTVNGRQGNDIIDTGPGNDRAIGAEDNDTLSGGADADSLEGDAGNDTLEFFADAVWGVGFLTLNHVTAEMADLEGLNRTYDTFSGGLDEDTLLMTDGDDAFILDDPVSPRHASTSGARATAVEHIYAGAGNDVVNLTSVNYVYGDVTIAGGEGHDIIWSGAGNDTLGGDAGNDQIFGGAGEDILSGGSGNDWLRGGEGDDELHFSADTIIAGGYSAWNVGSPGVFGSNEFVSVDGKNLSTDIYDGGDGWDVLYFGMGNDAFFHHNPYHALPDAGGDIRLIDIEEVFMGGGDDVFDLTQFDYGYGDIVVHGGEGNDALWSSEGEDTLNGDNGNDSLWGGIGDDFLYGGDGSDVLRGGPNASVANTVSSTTATHTFNTTLAFPTLQEAKALTAAQAGTKGIAAGDLSVDYTATASIKFVSTEAGYSNSLGFYSIRQDGTIQMTQLAFTNVKNVTVGTNYNVTLPGTPDADFGFFMLANGWNNNSQYAALDLVNGQLSFVYKNGTAQERLAKITDSAADIKLVYNKSWTEIVLNGPIYHSHQKGGSLNLNPDNAEHVVSGLKTPGNTSTLRIGFEDLPNLGDADYNDLVFDIKVNSATIQTPLVDDNDYLDGGNGTDTLYGGVGDDILVGGAQADNLYGDQGQDIFALTVLDGFVDTIHDFVIGAQGDELNITDILIGYDALTDAISDFVQMSKSGNDVIVAVNADGFGGDFVAAALIVGGVGGASVADLLAMGNIVADNSVTV